MENNAKGVIIIIDQNGSILEVKRNDFGYDLLGKTLLQIVDPMSLGKALSFLKTLKDEESSIGWELNLNLSNQLTGLFFSGSKYDTNYLLVGSTDQTHSRKLFNDLMKMSNVQLNEMRKIVKENFSAKKELEESHFNFDKLTELNNEMSNMQRRLAKTNQELTELNYKLEQKNAELDHFAYIVSHDLKAPLRGIVTLLEIIEEDFEDVLNKDVMELFDKIKKRGVRMGDLIQSILSYSRAGKMDAEVSSFNLREMIDVLIDEIAAPKTFKFIIPEVLPGLNCSYVQLSQVLANLLGNAVKYHDKNHGTIELRLEKLNDNWLRFEVKDDGPGIHQKYHDKLFGMFETANEVSREDSTGVGLAIVKKLVEQIGGEIGLNSEVGAGSEFWFSWPINSELE